jgi:hypothetical protein
LVNDSEYSKSADSKSILSPGCIYLFPLARVAIAVAAALKNQRLASKVAFREHNGESF